MYSCFDFSSLPNLLWYYHILTKSLSRKTTAMSEHQLLLSEDENPTTYPIPSPQPCHQSADYSHCCITKASQKKKKNSKQLKSKRTTTKKIKVKQPQVLLKSLYTNRGFVWALHLGQRLNTILQHKCIFLLFWPPKDIPCSEVGGLKKSQFLHDKDCKTAAQLIGMF